MIELTNNGTGTVKTSFTNKLITLIWISLTDTSHFANSGTITTPNVLVVTVNKSARVTSPPANEV